MTEGGPRAGSEQEGGWEAAGEEEGEEEDGPNAAAGPKKVSDGAGPKKVSDAAVAAALKRLGKASLQVLLEEQAEKGELGVFHGGLCGF